MRCFYVIAVLFIGSAALLSLVPEPAHGCDFRFFGRRVYYQPTVVYYQPYYAAPMYHQLPSGPTTAPARPTTIITIGASDNYFEPGKVTIQPGSTVRWVNQGKHKHTVTSNDSLWDSGDLAPGATYSVTFYRPGTYSYYCRHHAKMLGTIVVGDSTSGGKPAASGY